ncbi:MAG: DUF4870 domain-containing protein [Solirubrobacterales bacterium]|nr:DUF4870 domain-containing protein [Solirubrobacterales bacterium]
MSTVQPLTLNDKQARLHLRAAAAAHLSALVAVLVAVACLGPVIWAGGAGVTGPLLVLASPARRSAFARSHIDAAVRFNLSVAAYLATIGAVLKLTTGSPYTVQLVPFLLFVNMLVAFNWLVFTIIATQRAATGQLFTYPMTLRPPHPGRAVRRARSL